MKYLQELAKQYGPLAILLVSTVSFPLYSGIKAYQPAQVTVEASGSKPVTSLNELLPLLQVLAQKQVVPQPEPPAPVSGDPMLDAINRLINKQEEFARQIAEQDNRRSEQLTEFINTSYRAEPSTGRNIRKDLDELEGLVKQALVELNGGKVDRNGNTKEQLEDIYQDANIPQLPDPLAKGLAKYPGGRAMLHPDHGQPVIAVTEWGVTNYGGGKQLNLLRHKGKVYGQTVIHGDQSIGQKQAEPPKPEPFRLSLGNN